MNDSTYVLHMVSSSHPESPIPLFPFFSPVFPKMCQIEGRDGNCGDQVRRAKRLCKTGIGVRSGKDEYEEEVRYSDRGV